MWVAGTLMSRVISPPPGDGLDKAPSHDYSHIHVDQYNLKQYHYSALLYLSSMDLDFEGGSFEFIDAGIVGCSPDGDVNTQEELNQLSQKLKEDTGDPLCGIPEDNRKMVAPMRGRLLMFSAGKENPHRVNRARNGARYLFSVWLTTDPIYGYQD